MRSSVLLPQFFLSPSAIKLGRFVTNIDEPHRYYHDPKSENSFSIIEKVATQYDGADSLRTQRRFGSELTAFLSSTVSSRTNASIHVTTKQVKTYYLDNNGEWFRDIVKLKDVRKWIERTIDEGEDIYIVVGYHTVLDARIAEQAREQKLLDGNLAIPLSSALAASGVAVPFSELPDPRLAGSNGRAEDLQRHFVAQGEQIIAVQYRKVRFRFLSSKSVDTATLSKDARWERYDRPRYLQSDMEDMVEVELDDDLLLEGDRDKYIAGSEEIIFSNIGVDI
ncbi:uncharacterized protein N7479_000695 [Penicillium vulpinum]|uniref:Uncharacterized protein n=1 Tax=Penicillium vulpinum TaxID=29845 RepID=A0A1V6S794_9EURO|nr:uncharacterized protein N7479_000695 [Penicillium vulpinum]KAJ5970777.1 hypothetical protein N7479_000695 [Penicillium vulpinum]OQE09594.1 hypothetical protein PENVUL_c006G05785 [Penicillium vulpinum]